MSEFWTGVAVTIAVWWISGLVSIITNKKMGHTGDSERAFASTITMFGGPVVAVGFIVDFLRHRSLGNQTKEVVKK